MNYRVIHHPKRGWFCGWDWNSDMRFVPRFSWASEASHEKVEKFFSDEAVRVEIVKMEKAGVSGLTVVQFNKGE